MTEYRCTVGNCTRVYDTLDHLRCHIEKGKHTDDLVVIPYTPEPSNIIDSDIDMPNANLDHVVLFDEDSSEEENDADSTNSGESAAEQETITAPYQGFFEPVEEEEEDATYAPFNNSFNGSIVHGEFYPYKNKIHQLVHQFFYRAGSDITQGAMKQIMQLLEDVVAEVKNDPNGDTEIPASGHIFHYENTDVSCLPVMKTTKHEVSVCSKDHGVVVEKKHTFHMNQPTEIVKLLVSNPTLVDEVSLLPDHTEGEMVDSNQSNKWKFNPWFQHPMVTVSDFYGRKVDYWVGDVVCTADNKYYILSRFFTEQHTSIMADVYGIVPSSGSGHFILLAHEGLKKIKITDITSVVCDTPEDLKLELPANIRQDFVLFGQYEPIRLRFSRSHPLKKPRNIPTWGQKYKPVKVVPLNLFTDDMSGNKTKKHNKFDSWILVPGALSLHKRQQLENTFFVCTSHALSAMQMLPNIVDNLVKLENGVCRI